jgi:hypothetical protein
MGSVFGPGAPPHPETSAKKTSPVVKRRVNRNARGTPAACIDRIPLLLSQRSSRAHWPGLIDTSARRDSHITWTGTTALPWEAGIKKSVDRSACRP